MYINWPKGQPEQLELSKIFRKHEIFRRFLRMNLNSCMNIYAYSCLELLSNRPEAALKQQNPCSNHEIHVALEHGFY